MFDTMTLTKIAGGVFGAWLVLLLGKWAAEEVYHMDSHGEAAYVIDTGVEEEVEEVEEIDMVALVATAEMSSGAKIFKKCSSCHKAEDGANATGPYLYGVVGRDIASVDGFGYSGALDGLEGDWTIDALAAFLADPKGYAPGNKMSFKGIKKPQERADLIMYLDSLDD
jgi:cytochrome c